MTGQAGTSSVWGYAVQGTPAPLLQLALDGARRTGSKPEALPACNGEPCVWFRKVAEYVARGDYQRAVLFCDDPDMACCVANKVPGVRAAAVSSIEHAHRALRWGANLFAVRVSGRTFFEFKELLRVCDNPVAASCPSALAGVLEELEAHARR